MAQASVGWRVMTGQRVTSAAFKPEICVEAETDLWSSGENGIDRCEFSISVNGGAATTVTVASRSLRHPNYSAFSSPLNGARAGRMAPFDGFGFELDLSLYAAGTITINATVYSRAGTATPVPRSIVVYNDTDGGDRRPSTKTIYVATTGNDGNAGTAVSPVLTIQRAIHLAAANPAGSSSADRDVGGARIVVAPGTYIPLDSSPSTRHTSGHWWLTIDCEPGVTFKRGLTDPSAYLNLTGNGAGTSARIRINGARSSGFGIAINNNSSVITECWLDGCVYQSENWSKVHRWSVMTIPEMSLGKAVDFVNKGVNARSYVTCSISKGAFNGWSEFLLAQDTVVSDYTQLANETSDRGNGGGHICNQVIESQRVMTDFIGRVWGLIAGCTISVPANGQMRIEQNGPLEFLPILGGGSMNLSTLSELVGQTYFGISISGSAVGWHNSNTGGAPFGFLVLSAGTNAFGLGYVVLANSGAVAGTPPSAAGASVLIATVPRTSNDPDIAHPDLVYFIGPTQTNAMVSNVACRDIDRTQGLFTSATTLIRSSIRNFRDGGQVLLNHNMIGGNKTDLLMYGCSIAGTLQWGGVQTGCRGYDNVIGQASGISGGIWDYNHWITGSTFGDPHASVGAWFQFDTLTPPWFYDPLVARLDTASGLLPQQSQTRWPTSTGSTRGCNRFVGQFNWSTPADGTEASASGTVTVTGSATALVPTTASASGSVDVTGASVANLGIVAGAAGSVDVTGAAVADLGIVAAASISVDVTGASVAELSMAGNATGSVDVTGAAVAELGVVADASGTVDVTGASDAVLELYAASSGTVDVTGSAVGVFDGDPVDAACSGTVDVTGEAVVELGIVADAAGTVDVTGSSEVSVEVLATAGGLVTVSGTSTAELAVVAVAAPSAPRRRATVRPWDVPRDARPPRRWHT